MAGKRRIQPRFWIGMALVAAIVFALVHMVEQRHIVAQQREIDRLIAERDVIVAENAALERKIAFSKTDEYIERTARTDLGLLKPGEVRFVAGGSEADIAAQPIEPEQAEQADSQIAE